MIEWRLFAMNGREAIRGKEKRKTGVLHFVQDDESSG